MAGSKWGADWKSRVSAGQQARVGNSIPLPVSRDPESFLRLDEPAIKPADVAKAALALARKGALDGSRARAFGSAFALSSERHVDLGQGQTWWDDWRPTRSPRMPKGAEWALGALDLLLRAGPEGPRLAVAAGLESAGRRSGFGLCGLWMMRALLSDDARSLRSLLDAGVDPFGLSVSGLHPLDAAWLCDARSCAKPLAAAVMRVERPWIERWRLSCGEWGGLIASAPPVMSTRFWIGALEGGCSLASRAPVLVRSWERGALAPGVRSLEARFVSLLGRPVREPEDFERALPTLDEDLAMELARSMAAECPSFSSALKSPWSLGAPAPAPSALLPWLESIEIEEMAKAIPLGEDASRPRL